MLKIRHGLAAVVFALALLGCESDRPATPPLNSERIEQVFGSYGVEVLASDVSRRISSLYSTDNGVRTTRTLAVVAWAGSADARLADAHAAILGGASIGATLEAAGWVVEKHNYFYGETRASEEVSRLMRVPPGTMLATHGYGLAVTRDGRSSNYATIAEIHHPDYLDLETVETIYGSVWQGDAETEAVRALVDEGLARLGAQPSGRGE
jgi:hypothetical protein